MVSVSVSPAAPPVPLVAPVVAALVSTPPAPPEPLVDALEVLEACVPVVDVVASTLPPQAVRVTRASVDSGSQVLAFIVRLLLGRPPGDEPVTGSDPSDSMFFMLPNPFEPFPLIETARLHLRAPTLDDEEAMFRVVADPLVTKYLGRAPLTREKTREKLTNVLEGIRCGASILWMLIDRESGATLGDACLWNWNKPSFRAEVGYELAPSHWGRGLVPEAMAPILRFGFERMGLHSLEGQVNPENQGSIRVLEKLGFQKKTHLQGNYFNGESFEDTAVYSLLGPGIPGLFLPNGGGKGRE